MNDSSGSVSDKGHSSKDHGLAREIGLRDGIAIVAGTMIGSGIFLVPAAIAQQVPSLTMVLLVWIFGAAVSLAAALVLSELGAMFPQAGGLYVYLREAYGPTTAFLYGWASMVAIDSGATAAVSTAFGIYLGQLVNLSSMQVKLCAIGVIAVLTTINCLGVKFGKSIQNVFATCKIAGIGIMAVLLFRRANLLQMRESMWPAEGHTTITGFGVAVVAALWAYETSYNAAEFRNPQRDLPKALFLGTLIVSATYVLANIAYYAVLTPLQVAQSPRVAATALAAIFGASGASVLAVLIMVSTFGAANGMILSGPRIPFVMARSRVLPCCRNHQCENKNADSGDRGSRRVVVLTVYRRHIPAVDHVRGVYDLHLFRAGRDGSDAITENAARDESSFSHAAVSMVADNYRARKRRIGD
jgi:APA family basic amino acid/polyamine antiporter